MSGKEPLVIKDKPHVGLRKEEVLTEDASDQFPQAIQRIAGGLDDETAERRGSCRLALMLGEKYLAYRAFAASIIHGRAGPHGAIEGMIAQLTAKVPKIVVGNNVGISTYLGPTQPSVERCNEASS